MISQPLTFLNPCVTHTHTHAHTHTYTHSDVHVQVPASTRWDQSPGAHAAAQSASYTSHQPDAGLRLWLSWKFDGNSRKWKFPEISGNFQPLFGTSTPGVGNSGDVTGGWDANHAWATMKRWLNLIIHHLNRAIRAENKIQKQINHANQILNSQQRHCEVCSLCSADVEVPHTDLQNLANARYQH